MKFLTDFQEFVQALEAGEGLNNGETFDWKKDRVNNWEINNLDKVSFWGLIFCDRMSKLTKIILLVVEIVGEISFMCWKTKIRQCKTLLKATDMPCICHESNYHSKILKCVGLCSKINFGSYSL